MARAYSALLLAGDGLEDPHQLVSRNGAGEPLQLQLGNRLCLDAVFERRVPTLTQEDLPRCGLVAETRGEVRDPAENPVVVSSLEPDPAERRVADCDSGAETELVAPFPPGGCERPYPLAQCSSVPPCARMSSPAAA